MPAKIHKSAKKIMEQTANKILEDATEWLWARAVELSPMGTVGDNPYAVSRESKKTSAVGNIANALAYEIDYINMKGIVGLPIGSELEKISWYNEYGTGFRGSQFFVSFNGEIKPEFTIPIVPKTKSVLAWVSSGIRPTTPEGWNQARREGRAVFARSTKGLSPHPFLRPSLFELKTVYLEKIAKKVIKESFK